jgi:hypothetical protein
MARRSKGFIELEWTCPNCNTRNKGFEKTCVNCGAPQPENVQFEAPAEKKFVSEEKASELRARGADIHCGFCGTRNPSTAENLLAVWREPDGGSRTPGRARDRHVDGKAGTRHLHQLRDSESGDEHKLYGMRCCSASSCQSCAFYASLHSGCGCCLKGR